MGIGSKLKRAVRKIIPNEIAEVASAAAPLVAPFNPAVAAAMAGLGSFDRTGRIGRSLGAGLGTFALGQGARFLGGAPLQGNPFVEGGAFRPGSFDAFKGSFTSPLGTESGLGKLLASEPEVVAGQATGVTPEGDVFFKPGEVPTGGITQTAATGVTPEGDVFFKPGEIPGTSQATGKTTLRQFFNAPVGEKVEIAKNFFNNLTAKQKLGLGIGTVSAAIQYLENKALENDQLNLTLGPQLGYMGDLRGTNPRFTMAKEGGIIGLANGGEPAMEMDYRGGGFIPVGAKERADDVPARLSKNEFVMTADAVRAAGGGSVDLGAQRMYDLMNKLEAQA